MSYPPGGPPDVFGVHHNGTTPEQLPRQGRPGCARAGPQPSPLSRASLTGLALRSNRQLIFVGAELRGQLLRASPFTKPADSSVEYSLASSTASEITTLVGTSGHHPSSKVAIRRTARSTTGMRSSDQSMACLASSSSDAGLVGFDAASQCGCVRLGRHRQLGQQVTDVLLFQVALVEQFESALARTPAAPKPNSSNSRRESSTHRYGCRP